MSQLARVQEEGGLKAEHYHGGMNPKERTRVQNGWRTGSIQARLQQGLTQGVAGGGMWQGRLPAQVCCSTIAFGMGIDHPHVRCGSGWGCSGGRDRLRPEAAPQVCGALHHEPQPGGALQQLRWVAARLQQLRHSP